MNALCYYMTKKMMQWRAIPETENVHTGGFTAKQSYRKQAYKRRDRGNAVFFKAQQLVNPNKNLAYM